MSGPQPDEPNYFVLIAPGAVSNDPTPAWVDVSTQLRSVSIRRGADKHLDEDQPGEATILLDNYQGTWDNDNTASPYTGQLVADMRVRVLAEWDGDLYERFNGYLDDIELEYPDGAAEAWATFRATDAFKVLAGAKLPVSVYADAVATDAPVLWWRFDDPQYLYSALDSSGNGHTGTPNGKVRFGGETLIVRDPGSSLEVTEEGNTNVQAALSLSDASPFAFEFWFMWEEQPAFIQKLAQADSAGNADVNFQINNATSKGGMVYTNDAGASFSAQLSAAFVLGTRYHVVCTHAADRRLRVYVNGTEAAYSVQDTTSGTTTLDRVAVGSLDGQAATRALVDEFAVYSGTLPSATRIAAHYAAGTAPWDGDTPAERAGRICDVIGWPALLRDFDAGESTLQSASLDGQSALDHLLKVAASEFGELHVSKEGAVQLRARRSLVNRDQLADFGPATDEIRYRAIRFSSGADLVRNPVTVSRAEGVAQTVSATATYYDHQFTLDGLYHDSDDLSLSAAQFLLSEFKDQKRRIAGLTFGPFDAERLFDWFPLLLDAELGDVYQVTFHPPNGDDLVQLCVLEGTEESWSADTGIGEVRWSLSRAYAGSFWQLGVHGRSELGETTRLYF